MKELARIEINMDGGHADMTFSVVESTEDERIVIGTCVARALLDLCADFNPGKPGIAALRFLSAAVHLPRSDERMLS